MLSRHVHSTPFPVATAGFGASTVTCLVYRIDNERDVKTEGKDAQALITPQEGAEVYGRFGSERGAMG